MKDQRIKIETFLSETNAGRQFQTQSLFTFQGLYVGVDPSAIDSDSLEPLSELHSKLKLTFYVTFQCGR